MSSNDFWKVRKGIVIRAVTSDPSGLDDGSIFYNSTLGKFRKKENGVVSDLDTVGAGTPFDASSILTMPATAAFSGLGWQIMFDVNGNVLTRT